MKLPRRDSQKEGIQRQINKLEAEKVSLLRKKDKYQPVKFYKELNNINRKIEKLEKKI
jgi:hypothetical protein